MNNIKEQEQKLIEQLGLVKEQFIKNQTELNLSIRKDIVAAELKDILTNNPDFYSLKGALESYISNLYKME